MASENRTRQELYSETRRDLLARQNREQIAPVHECDGPLLLLAGPGTGKTYSMALRIKYLVNRGVDPTAITVITFTAAAAANMRRRISDPANEATFIPGKLQPKIISTVSVYRHRA